MNVFKKIRQHYYDKRTAKITRWIGEGEQAFIKGHSPQQSPFKYGSQAHIWWICGWTIAWQLEEGERE